MMTTTIPLITLNNGVSIPQLGHGTFQIPPDATRAATLAAFERTMHALDLGYLDLFLIHWPMPRNDDYLEAWQAMAETAAQVTLRWHLQRGDIVFPKSVNPSRMPENFAVFDFRLTDHEITAILRPERGERTGSNPEDHHTVPQAA